jgi:hypothetical protein
MLKLYQMARTDVEHAVGNYNIMGWIADPYRRH